MNEDFTSHLPKDIRKCLDKTLLKITSFKQADFLTKELYLPSTHLLNKNGKLLRPALFFLSAKAIGENGLKFINLATAIELIHVSSLIHDDIIDNEKYRRGKETVNYKYGDSIALLAGNALISKAIDLSTQYGKEVMYAVSEAALKMCAGELMDYKSQKNRKILSIKDYTKIAELKTASLIGTACNIIAVYKNSSSKSALYNYGVNMGLAFQIRDDINDFVDLPKQQAKQTNNIVVSIKNGGKISSEDALRVAANLNHKYISNATKVIEGTRIAASLSKYADMIKVI
jgi:geranylgeranyl pyrophosphate synthase